MDEIRNYPLTWPILWPRISAQRRKIAQFADRSMAKAIAFVLDELRLMGACGVVVSSNLQTRLDGLPKSGQKNPADPGVAVYFTLKNEPRVLACDKWTLVQDNLWAIGLHIESVRGQERWGVGTIEQAFAGYAALPAPKTAWWEILGVAENASEEQVRAIYRAQAKRTHPDSGGNDDLFRAVQNAWEQALKEKGWK